MHKLSDKISRLKATMLPRTRQDYRSTQEGSADELKGTRSVLTLMKTKMQNWE